MFARRIVFEQPLQSSPVTAENVFPPCLLVGLEGSNCDDWHLRETVRQLDAQLFEQSISIRAYNLALQKGADAFKAVQMSLENATDAVGVLGTKLDRIRSNI